MRLKRLSEPTLSVLQRELRRGQYHIFHFIGHGGFDPRTQGGVLVLSDETGRGRLVAADHLGTILHDHRSLRLVVLNACEGARSTRADPFAGVAQTFVQQGIPAVIAMQFEITDQAALIFAGAFYGAIADGYPVDAALAEARKAIFIADNDIEWGTPVLFLRAPTGQLFLTMGSPESESSAPTSSGVGQAEKEVIFETKAIALSSLVKAADAGDATAMFNLGALYDNGQGVAQDYVKARRVVRKGRR